MSFTGKVFRTPPNTTPRLTPDDFPGRAWAIADKAIRGDGRLQQERTIVRSAFAIGQVVRLAVGLANGSIRAVSNSTYEMPDYESGNPQIPYSGNGTQGFKYYFDDQGHIIPEEEAVPGTAPPCKH